MRLRVLAFVLLVPALARADAKEDAAIAYDRGARAYDRGDYALAASELARADELAPNAVTLELAIAAAVKADDAVIGMTLVERASARKGIKETVLLGARKKLAPKVGRVVVRCSDCEATVDGSRMPNEAPRFVSVGPHIVTLTRPSAKEERIEILVDPGKTVDVAPAQPAPANEVKLAPTLGPAPTPPPTPAPSKEEPRSLSPVWFWAGLGLTAVAAGAGTVSAIDTAAKHDAFLKDRSDAAASRAGQDAETRTYILFGAAAAFAVATAVIGLGLVKWDRARTTAWVLP
jgi:hypothetical protein